MNLELQSGRGVLILGWRQSADDVEVRGGY